MKNFKVKNTDIVDCNDYVEDQEDNARLSYISVCVDVEIDNLDVRLVYQTTGTPSVSE